MRDEIQKYKCFSRRSLVLCAIKFTLFSTILGKYYYLQISQSRKYKVLSDKNRIKLTVIPPFRGIISDRSGEILAANKKFYRVILESTEIKNAMQTIKQINKILGAKKLDESEENLKKKIKKKKHFSSLVLGKYLTWDEVSKIEVNADILTGVEVDIGQERFYPYKHYLAHVIGYISSPTNEEVEKSSLPNFQDFKIGKNGVEKTLDNHLHGLPGLKKTEVDAYGRQIRKIAVDPAIAGQNLSLTIDAKLQAYIANLLEGKQGSIVVMDVNSGNVLAMHSSPAYDPNLFINGIAQDDWDKLLQNKHKPLINKTISIPYPPGSTFKIITALAALSSGIKPNHTIVCKGKHKVGTHTFRCWKKGGHGKIHFQKAIAQSCNVFFYDLAERVGIRNIKKIANIMGLGKKTGVQMPFENAGLIPYKAWKKNRYSVDWYIGDTVNAAIGQGYVLTTPIQLALMSARLASGNKLMPNIILGETELEQKKLAIKPSHLEFVRKGLYLVFKQ